MSDDLYPAWGGACDTCETIVIVDGNGRDIPDPSHADDEPIAYCPWGHGRIYFDSQGETQWKREGRLMRSASERAFSSVAEQLRLAAVPVRSDNTIEQRAVGDVLREYAALFSDRAKKYKDGVA